jgi:hypothetical protein
MLASNDGKQLSPAESIPEPALQGLPLAAGFRNDNLGWVIVEKLDFRQPSAAAVLEIVATTDGGATSVDQDHPTSEASGCSALSVSSQGNRVDVRGVITG